MDSLPGQRIRIRKSLFVSILSQNHDALFPDYGMFEEVGVLMSDWITFLCQLGRFVAGLDLSEGQRANAIVSVPILDYASLITASGVICDKFEDRSFSAALLNEWESRIGENVVFPLVKKVRDVDRDSGYRKILLRKEGVVESVGTNPVTNRPMLEICYLDQKIDERQKNFKYFLPLELIPLVRSLENDARIDSSMRGSRIAEDFEGLEAFLGARGAIDVIGSNHKTCCIFDTKIRVLHEAVNSFPGSRLTGGSGVGDVVMRDVVRFYSDGREAVRESSCCKILSDPEPGWPVAVVSGSLRFLRFWDDCPSPVRIGIISAVENSYGDAVEFANVLFRRRNPGAELIPPRELMKSKPRAMDAQFFFSS